MAPVRHLDGGRAGRRKPHQRGGPGKPGRSAELDGVDRLDISGSTVMPGLIDAHCHVTFDAPCSNDELFFHRRAPLSAIIAAADVRKLLCAGVTGFFDADSIYEIGTDLRDAIEAGVVEGPRMSAGGYAAGHVGRGYGRGPIPDDGSRGYAVIVRSRDEIVAEVRRQIKHGVDWIKVHVTGIVPRQRARGELTVWSMDELRTVCDTAHALGIPVVGHCRIFYSTRDAVREDRHDSAWNSPERRGLRRYLRAQSTRGADVHLSSQSRRLWGDCGSRSCATRTLSSGNH